jgi:hypothetical protein
MRIVPKPHRKTNNTHTVRTVPKYNRTTNNDIVALFVFIWDFGTVLTVWHYLFLYENLELF